MWKKLLLSLTPAFRTGVARVRRNIAGGALRKPAFLAPLALVAMVAALTLIGSLARANPGDPVMVKDINPGASGSGPQLLTELNRALFFVANDGVHGQELWKLDTTAITPTPTP